MLINTTKYEYTTFGLTHLRKKVWRVYDDHKSVINVGQIIIRKMLWLQFRQVYVTDDLMWI